MIFASSFTTFASAFPRPGRTPGDQVCALSIHLQVTFIVITNNINIITTIILNLMIVLFISDVRSTALASVTSMSPYSFDRSAEVNFKNIPNLPINRSAEFTQLPCVKAILRLALCRREAFKNYLADFFL